MSYNHIKHREFKIPITKKGKFKIYLRFIVDTKNNKLYIRNAFLTKNKKDYELDIKVIEKETYLTILEIPEFKGGS